VEAEGAVIPQVLVPLLALIMAMIAVPFAFLVGNRGAMTALA